MPRAPSGDVEGRGVFRQLPVGIAIRPEGIDGDAEVEEGAETCKVADAGEAAEESSSDFQRLVEQGCIVMKDQLDDRAIRARAGGDDGIDGLIVSRGESACREEIEYVATPVIRRHLKCVAVIQIVLDVRIGAMFEKLFDGPKRIVSADGVLEWRSIALSKCSEIQ